jgi:DNA polymerase I
MADENSRVHPTIWPVGTRTARMSITSPALQTLPRKDPTVRDAFVPTTSDNVLIAIDADQIEFRLAAHFSRDEGLRHAFLNTPDVFNAIASEAFGDTITKGDPRRQTMKNGVYGKLYGAGVAKIAVTAGVPVHAMEVVMARFDQMYPGILQLQRQIESVARQRAATEGRPYVVTPTGRRMPGDPGKEYTLVNYLIQSHAAEILKRGINDLDAVGLGEYLILPVHDELVLDVPREDLDDIKQTLVNTLNAVGKDYFVPLTWGADVMQERWGDKYRK